MAGRRTKKRNRKSALKRRKKHMPSRSSRQKVRRKKATIRPRKKRPSPRKRMLKRRPVRQKKKVLKKTLRPKKPKTVPGKKQPEKKPLAKKKVEEKEPRKPTEEERRELRKILNILSDAYVRQILIEIGGENALAIVRNFYGNSSDEELAKKLKIKISDVRATLNKLHNEGLVNYIREKDSETGWYSYSWSLNHERMKRWAISQTNKLDILSNGEDYYFCPTCGAATITNFESAANGDFRCERCNRLLEFIDEKRMTELYEKKSS